MLIFVKIFPMAGKGIRDSLYANILEELFGIIIWDYHFCFDMFRFVMFMFCYVYVLLCLCAVMFMFCYV